MELNPYRFHGPVRHDDFVGRWEEVHRITKNLLSPIGDSFAIIAGRRCGKSSLLEALAYTLLNEKNTLPFGWRILPVMVDLKRQPFESPGEFFAYLLRKTHIMVDVNEKWNLATQWARLVDLNEPWYKQLTDKAVLEFDEFEMALWYILNNLADNDPQNLPARVVLMIDEADEVLQQPWTGMLLNQMRSLIYSSPLRDKVRWVLAGSHDLLKSVDVNQSTLWEVLEKQYLVPINEQGMHKLLAQARDCGLSSETADAVISQSGGHLYLAQYLLHNLWEIGLESSHPDQVNVIADQFTMEEIGTLQGWNSALGTTALQVFQVLTNVSGFLEVSEIAQRLNKPSSQIKTSLLALCCHNVVIHNRWQRYRYGSEIFRTWVSQLKTIPLL